METTGKFSAKKELSDDEIFSNSLKKYFCSDEEDIQLNFLKIYPVYKSNVDIVTEWIKMYKRKNGLNKRNNKKKYNKRKSNRRQQYINKQIFNMLRFLQFGYNNNYLKFNNNQINTLINLLETTKKTSYANEFKDKLNDNLSEDSHSMEPIPNSLHSSLSYSTDDYFNNQNIDINHLAINLTELCCKEYNKISSHEIINYKLYYNKNIPKGKFQQKYPHISKLTELFNKFSYWIPFTILNAETKKTRIKTYNKFIDLAIELKKLNNFHLFAATIAALHNHVFNKIDYLKINKNNKSIKLNKLNELENSDGYPECRILLSAHNLATTDLIMPYMGMFTADLTKILENNSKYDRCDNKLDNKFIKQMVDFIDFFEKYKKKYANYTNNNLYNTFIVENILNITKEDNVDSLDNFLESFADKISQSSNKKNNVVISKSTNFIGVKRHIKQKKVHTRKSSNNYSLKSKSEILINSNRYNSPQNKNEIRSSSISSNSISDSLTIRSAIFKELRNILNKSYKEWNTNDVCLWLEYIDLAYLQQIFKDESIDGSVLPNLLDTETMKQLKITTLGNRLKLKNEISKIVRIPVVIKLLDQYENLNILSSRSQITPRIPELLQYYTNNNNISTSRSRTNSTLTNSNGLNMSQEMHTPKSMVF